jgi:hypothetical protein
MRHSETPKLRVTGYVDSQTDRGHKMQILTVSIKTDDIRDKVVWFLKHLEQDGVEILSQEDLADLRLLMATRGENSVSFSEYLKNED